MSLSLMNMGSVLDFFSQAIKLKSITTSSVDFAETETVNESFISAVVQVADNDKLTADNIDYSLEYLMVHTRGLLENNQYIEYKGKDYKIISVNPYDDYGYNECVAEQTKRVVK